MKFLFCLNLIIFCAVCPAYGTELIAPAFTGLISEDGTGTYQIIMKEAASRAGVSFTEKVFPQKRALSTFYKNENSCIYSFTEPASETMGKDRVVVSTPLSVFKMYIFTGKGKPALTSVKQLKGRVAGVLGYEVWYDKTNIKESGIDLDMASSDDEALGLLRRDRIQAIISFLPDMNSHLGKLSFSPEHPLFVSYDGITCHNNETGRRFIRAVSPVLREMDEDGTMKKILGDSYLEWGYSDFLEWKKRNTSE